MLATSQQGALSPGPTVRHSAEAVARTQQDVKHFLFRKDGWGLFWSFRHEVSLPNPHNSSRCSANPGMTEFVTHGRWVIALWAGLRVNGVY